MNAQDAVPTDIAASCAAAEPSAAAAGGIRQSIWLTLVVLVAMMVVGWGMLGAGIYLSLAVHLGAGILFPAILFVRWRRRGLVTALRLHWCGMRPLVFGMMLGAGASCLGVLVQLVLGPFPGEYWPFIPLTWSEFGWALLIGALGPGICEEVLFRGVIQGLLSRRGRWTAIQITALLFGALHLNVWQLCAGFLVGIVLGWMVERSGSLFPAIAGHATINAIAFAAVFASGSTHVFFSWWFVGPFAGIGVLGLIGFLMFTRDSPRPDSEMKTASAAVSKFAWAAVLVPLVFLSGLLLSGRTGAWSLELLRLEVDGVRAEQDVKPGEYAFTLNPQILPVTIYPGDDVLFVADGAPGIGIVRSVAGDSVMVDQQGTLRVVPSEAIRTKTVCVVRLPWWSGLSAKISPAATNPR